MKRKVLYILLVLCAVTALGASTCVAASAVDSKVVSAPATLIVNTTVTGALTSETDYEEYVFTLTEPGWAQTGFAPSSAQQGTSVGWKITLYEQYSPDGLGKELVYREITYNYSSLADSWNEKKISASNKVGLLPGNYMVKIEAAQIFAGSEYSFVVNFTPSTMWEDEFNDAFSRYTPLTLVPDAQDASKSSAMIYGSSSQRSDETPDTDYFMFELKEDNEVNLTFAHENLTTERMVGWKIAVYDSSFNEIAEVDSGWTATSVSTGSLGLAKGYYYICVSSMVYSGTDYTLTLTAAPLADWEKEINDTVLQANTLPTPGFVTGTLSPRDEGFDKDYYKITVADDGCFTIKFRHENLGEVKGGWNIVLMDKNSVPIHKMISYWNVAEIASPKIGLPAGTYYVRIDSDNRSFNSAKYTLACEFVATDDWETENNDAPIEADPMILNKAYNGALIEDDVEYDKDYYKFTLTGYSDIKIMFIHQNLTQKQEGWVISIINDNSDNYVTMSSSWDESLAYSRTVTLGPGTYYLCVDTGMYYSSAAYSVTLVDVTPPVTNQSFSVNEIHPASPVDEPAREADAESVPNEKVFSPAETVIALPPERDEFSK